MTKLEKIMNIEDINMSFLYWKYGIFELFKYYPSNKSLNSLIERLEIWKKKSNKIDISRIFNILFSDIK